MSERVNGIRSIGTWHGTSLVLEGRNLAGNAKLCLRTGNGLWIGMDLALSGVVLGAMFIRDNSACHCTEVKFAFVKISAICAFVETNLIRTPSSL